MKECEILQKKILELSNEVSDLENEVSDLENDIQQLEENNADLINEITNYEFDEEIINEHIFDRIKIDFDKITVSDEMKLKLLLELYHKCSLEEVQGLLNWKPGYGIQRKINY